jgi:hypothetical protein
MKKVPPFRQILFVFWNLISRVKLLFGQPSQLTGACNHCGNCCRVTNCRFFSEGTENGNCRIYGSVFRRILNCSSYPMNEFAIKQGNCTGYSTVESGLRKVIPISHVLPQSTPPSRLASRYERATRSRTNTYKTDL